MAYQESKFGGGLAPADELSSQVEINLSCSGLQNRDLLSNTDGFAVVSMKPSRNAEWVEIGRSETIQDNQNPEWTHHFIVTYHFESVQHIQVKVYDRDSSSENLSAHDYLGKAEFTLGALMGATGQAKDFVLENNTRRGTPGSHGHLQVRGEELTSCGDIVKMRFHALQVDNKDGFFGKSDPFLVIKRSREDGNWIRVFTGPVVMNNLSPSWNEFSIAATALCNADYDRPLVFEVWDWDSDGSHDFIGAMQSSVHGLQGQLNREMAIRNEAKAKKKGRRYQNSGRLVCSSIQIERHPTMLDYIRGGCEININMAIDFTASNGSPSSPGTLHFRNPTGVPNSYQQAIQLICEIVGNYDHDNLYPVYGFGAKVGGKISHNFALTFDETRPSVHGIEGVMGVYNHALNNVRLSGPTLFHPIIQRVAADSQAHFSATTQKYNILLFITDGAISDMQSAVDSIVAASATPMSIIIIGVGSDAEAFEGMEALDGDDGHLVNSRGQRAARDIVQFVPMCNHNGRLDNLAAEVLAEVPRQLINYMKQANVMPNEPIPPAIGQVMGVNAPVGAVVAEETKTNDLAQLGQALANTALAPAGIPTAPVVSAAAAGAAMPPPPAYTP